MDNIANTNKVKQQNIYVQNKYTEHSKIASSP